MESLLKSLSQHGPEFLLGLIVLSLVAVVWSWRNWAAVRQTRLRFRSLLEGARGENLERLLLDHLRERMELESKVLDAAKRIVDLESKSGSALRHSGLVRYDAFEDVGGSQSFALALYDDQGNGMVLNGIVGRTDCRVYCKPLVNGRTDRTLSPEEARAVAEAARSRHPSAVTT